MLAASQTTGSPAGIWAIIIVAVVALAFWLSAIFFADRSQARASGRTRLAVGAGAVPSGTWAGGSVPGTRAAEIPGEAVPQAEAPTRADIPAQRAGETAAAERQEMPRQRSGDADRAARSRTRPGPPDDEEPGR